MSCSFPMLLCLVILMDTQQGRSPMCQFQEIHRKRLTFRKDDAANLLHHSEITSIVTAGYSSNNTFHCFIPGSSLIAQGCKCQVMGDMEQHLQEAPENTISSFTARCELLIAYDHGGKARSTLLYQKLF